MGSKTPIQIKKRKSVGAGLKATPEIKIAKKVDIGAGIVSLIIKEFKQNDPELDLLREVALIIKNEGMDLIFQLPRSDYERFWKPSASMKDKLNDLLKKFRYR